MPDDVFLHVPRKALLRRGRYAVRNAQKEVQGIQVPYGAFKGPCRPYEALKGIVKP